MKWYVATDKVDWADEFDLPFGELIDEPTYKKYKYISDTLKSYTGFYGFGTNEDFDNFEYLGWEFDEITEDEKKILDKLGLPNGYTFIDNLFNIIENDMIDNNIIYPEDIKVSQYGYKSLKENFYTMPFHKFADYVDKYAKFLKDGDED